MLFRLQAPQRELLTLLKRRQLVLERLVFFVATFFGFLVDLEEAVELQHRAGDAEEECVAVGLRIDVHRGLIEHRRIHLRGDEALPDQLVELELVFFQILLDAVRRARGRSRPDGFVRCLRFLLFFVNVGCFRQVLGTVLTTDQFAHLCDRII